MAKAAGAGVSQVRIDTEGPIESQAVASSKQRLQARAGIARWQAVDRDERGLVLRDRRECLLEAFPREQSRIGAADKAHAEGKTGSVGGGGCGPRFADFDLGLGQDQVDTRPSEVSCVIVVFCRELGVAGNTVRPIAILEGGRRARHPTAPGSVGAGALCEFDGKGSELEGTIPDAATRESASLGAEGIRGENFAAGSLVLAVDGFDDIGRFEQRVRRPQGQRTGDAAAFEKGSEGPVEDHGARLGKSSAKAAGGVGVCCQGVAFGHWTGVNLASMSGSRAILSHPQAGRVASLRLGLRRTKATASAEALDFGPEFSSSGEQRLGPLRVELAIANRLESLQFEAQVANPSAAPVSVESVVLSLLWTPPANAGALRYLKHGWQSWSFTGARNLDASADPAFPGSPWLRGLHHVEAEVPGDRAGWFESATVGVAGTRRRGAACLVGAQESGRQFCVVYLRRAGDAVEFELEWKVETVLEPGENVVLEPLCIALGPDASGLLENFGTLWGRSADARASGAFQAGWCSWYHFFHGVTEDQLLRNLDALAHRRDALPIEVVQLDDGYQRAVGDWLETNDKFPSGLPAIARRIGNAGFRPGIWTAPFCVVPESRVHAAHPEWLLRNPEEGPEADAEPWVGTFVREWTATGAVHALDPSREDVRLHIEEIFRELTAMGFEYLKLDFLHCVAARSRAMDRGMNRAARLREGLLAIRRGAGEDAFLLGCGSPLGPAVGIVDAMRIGPDVAPAWDPQPPIVPGIEAAMPSTANALRSTLLRAWMQRRLWINDPDCLMTRSRATQLSAAESTSLANVIAGTGGMVVFSDDVPGLQEVEVGTVAECIEIARRVDAMGGVRVPDLLEADTPGRVQAGVGARRVEVAFNPGSGVEGSAGSAPLPAHASRIDDTPPRRKLAVFCDFDGTFSVQDVGSTLVMLHRAKERPAVQERFRRREITAWESNMLLLHGLELPEEDLDAFLGSIDPDPGARRLFDWSRVHAIDFEILSDGFDYNLDRLQKLFGFDFPYLANRLVYEAGRWSIAPGAPDPACTCGTGVCKRARIEDYRREHPDVVLVHIGNGQVSDLCGAIAADLAFAKDTLASALAARGEAFWPFETLDDVVQELQNLGFGAGSPGLESR